jgi:hypothetical protein
MRLVVAALAVALAGGAGVVDPAAAQSTTRDELRPLLDQLQKIAGQGDRAPLDALLAASADRTHTNQFADEELAAGVTRAIVRERDRTPLVGTLPGNGYSLIVDAFQEFGDRARSATWRVDVKQTGALGGEPDWRIADLERLASVESLFRLSLTRTKQFAAHGLRIHDGDLTVALEDGSVFVAEIDQGATAMVLMGRGTVSFRPEPRAEKGQVKIFAGAEALTSAFDTAYVRFSPADFDRLFADGPLTPHAVDAGQLRRAEGVFREEAPKSYSLDLGDLSRDTWSLVPGTGDLVFELRTKRFETLTYSRARADLEDVTLFDRKRHKTIALYRSTEAAARRATTSAEDGAAYEVLHYDIDVSVTPERSWVEGRARMQVRVRANALSNLTMRLSDDLVVQSITSEQYGRLFGMRVKGQNSLIINLPAAVLGGSDFSVTVEYAGRLEPQPLESEVVAVQQPTLAESLSTIRPERNFLYSNQSNWYPARPAGGFATATFRISVPFGLACIASGEEAPSSPEIAAAKDGVPSRSLYVFNAVHPVRYFAFIVSRFEDAEHISISFPDRLGEHDGAPVPGGSLNVSVETNPRGAGHGREIADHAAQIALFYQSLLADSPYPSFTVALVESDTPGGHSPGYFAALNQPLPTSPYSWRDDPASFDNYPDFFLAHEMAHQWWGQAVGWRSYHDQWLSEGFSQYFSAMYAEHQGGPGVFRGVMRQMRKWAIDASGQGPISLGYRLGHLKSNSKVFRALVYNKSAIVLHMLRQLVGDDAFQNGVRRFYAESRFRNVGTEDFKRVMEQETGESLDRFFERWIDEDKLPQLTFSYRLDEDAAILRIEQSGDIFDLPVAVTLRYTDARSTDVVMRVRERVAELRVPLEGTLRVAEISKNDSPLAHILKN